MPSLLVAAESQRSIGVALCVAGVLACLPTGCAKAPAPSDRGFGPSVLIQGVPHVQQKPDFCGEADVEMYLRFLGKEITQDQVFAMSGMDPARGKGVTTTELATALARLGTWRNSSVAGKPRC